MKYKYNTFSSLPRKIKRLIAMAFRAYILSSKARWERKKIEVSSPKYGLPDEAISQFMSICKKKGLHLSRIEATKEAHNLINLYKTLI